MLLLSEFSLSISCLFKNIPIQCIVAPAKRIRDLGIWVGRRGGGGICPKCPMVDPPLVLILYSEQLVGSWFTSKAVFVNHVILFRCMKLLYIQFQSQYYTLKYSIYSFTQMSCHLQELVSVSVFLTLQCKLHTT